MKHHTIIFVPHARARFRKWRVTNRQLTTAASTIGVLAVLSLFTTWSFFTNTIDRQELERVQQENDALREVNASFEDNIRTLQRQLGDFEERTRQLAIVAGLDNLSEAGIGGSTSDLGPSEIAAEDGFDTISLRTVSLAEELDRISDQLAERRQWIASTPAIAPVRGILTSGFGLRRDPIDGRRSLHEGIDIATSPGRPVAAAADGVVLRAGRNSGLGNAVYLSHGYGLTTRYGHMSKISVEAGQRVHRGDTLGYVGSTGRATGYHLHYEVREQGRAVDPIAYMLDDPLDRS